MLRAAPGAVPGGRVQASQPEIDAAYAKGKADAEESHERMRAYRGREQALTIAAGPTLRDALVAEGVDQWDAIRDRLAEHASAIAEALRGRAIDNRLDRARQALEGALKALEVAS